MNRRNFITNTISAAVAISAAGRLALQPELKVEPMENVRFKLEKIQIVVDELNQLVNKAWTERMFATYRKLANNASYESIGGGFSRRPQLTELAAPQSTHLGRVRSA